MKEIILTHPHLAFCALCALALTAGAQCALLHFVTVLCGKTKY